MKVGFWMFELLGAIGWDCAARVDIGIDQRCQRGWGFHGWVQLQTQLAGEAELWPKSGGTHDLVERAHLLAVVAHQYQPLSDTTDLGDAHRSVPHGTAIDELTGTAAEF